MTGAKTARLLLLVFLGSLALQTAWILATPPFRGIDEFDQAFRADAVAGGQWHADYNAPVDGRGNLVIVRRSIAQAARPECYTYAYTGYANCNLVASVGHGRVTIASAAARYNPVFYWLVGTPARLFSGAAALEAMRVTAAVICSLMVMGIAWIIRLWAKGSWPWIGTVIAMTPMVIYSTMVPGPNGVEMLGGLGVWAALIGLSRVGGDRRREGPLIWAAVPYAICLVGVRALGPLWLAMVVLTCVGYLGLRNTARLLASHVRTWATAITIVMMVALAGIGWTLTQGTDSPSLSPNHHYPDKWSSSLLQLLAWPFQSFGVFPTRSEVAPNTAYLLGFLVFGVFLAVSFKLCRRTRLRLVLLSMIALAMLVPLLITLVVYTHSGTLWQGRYTLPYSLGIPLLASLTFDERPLSSSRSTRPAVLAGLSLLMVSYCVCVVHVLAKERVDSPLLGTSEWWIPSPWLVSALTVAGLGLWALAGKLFPALREPGIEPEECPQETAPNLSGAGVRAVAPSSLAGSR